MNVHWYEFNDTKVEKCSAKKEIDNNNWSDDRDNSFNAYMLVYVCEEYLVIE